MNIERFCLAFRWSLVPTASLFLVIVRLRIAKAVFIQLSGTPRNIGEIQMRCVFCYICRNAIWKQNTAKHFLPVTTVGISRVCVNRGDSSVPVFKTTNFEPAWCGFYPKASNNDGSEAMCQENHKGAGIPQDKNATTMSCNVSNHCAWGGCVPLPGNLIQPNPLGLPYSFTVMDWTRWPIERPLFASENSGRARCRSVSNACSNLLNLVQFNASFHKPKSRIAKHFPTRPIVVNCTAAHGKSAPLQLNTHNRSALNS